MLPLSSSQLGRIAVKLVLLHVNNRLLVVSPPAFFHAILGCAAECSLVTYMWARNQPCGDGKINICCTITMARMEAAFLIQPWIATRTITDYCRLCYQTRNETGFLECKRAHLAGYNTLLATLRMESNPRFGDIFKRLEDAKETCLSTRNPGEQCFAKMQNTLQDTQQLYDEMLDDYKSKYSRIPNRPTATAPM